MLNNNILINFDTRSNEVYLQIVATTVFYRYLQSYSPKAYIMTEVGTRDIQPPLNWDVFVTPGIPIATTDLPPGMKQDHGSKIITDKTAD